MKKNHISHLWIILGAFGVWFAVISAIQEVLGGTFWKPILVLVLGLITWWWIEFGKK